MQMAKPSDHPGFKQLLAEWNQKLYESGFRDVEDEKFGERILKKSGSARRYEKLDIITREAKFEYFRRLQTLVHETHFDNEFERQVMALYAQGVSQAMIKRVMKIEGHRCKVYYPIYRWLKTWGLK